MIAAKLRFWLSYLPRARHVLQTEGASVLFRKLLRRLKNTPLSVAPVPQLLNPRRSVGPFVLPRAETPRVSIIVPVFNQLSFTIRCLASLGRQGRATSLEVIVVDDASTDETCADLLGIEGLRLVHSSENQGFIRSCNRGANQARGDYLVFLNNDTQVQPSWLDALMGTFEQRPDAGLVGSRLIYPDGRQQEAGAILAADGSAWNYGHLDDPYKPEYSYLREADYCSGAALAIPRSLFERLGGFDEHFAPAYYEDADLAMRVRAAGYRVYYQPAARVVHFEGVSAGTDRGPVVLGMKRYQAINREKFLARWGAEIADWGVRGEDLEHTKERWVRQRALMVDNYMPTPDRESGSLRTGGSVPDPPGTSAIR